MLSFSKAILTIISSTLPLLISSTVTPYCDGILYHDISVEYDIHDIHFDPAGVCEVDYYKGDNKQMSTMLQCTQDGTDIVWSTWSNTNCEGEPIQSFLIIHDEIPYPYEQIGSGSYSNYSVICTDIPCNYAIVRDYPVLNCNDSIDISSDKYSDNIIVINDTWRTLNNPMYMVHTKCNEGQSIQGYSMREDIWNDNVYHKINDTMMEGECSLSYYSDQSRKYHILCGTAILNRSTHHYSTVRENNKINLKVVVTVSVGAFIMILFVVLLVVKWRLNMQKKNIADESVNFVMESIVDEKDVALDTNHIDTKS